MRKAKAGPSAPLKSASLRMTLRWEAGTWGTHLFLVGEGREKPEEQPQFLRLLGRRGDLVAQDDKSMGGKESQGVSFG
jgi:hypothetical protein